MLWISKNESGCWFLQKFELRGLSFQKEDFLNENEVLNVNKSLSETFIGLVNQLDSGLIRFSVLVISLFSLFLSLLPAQAHTHTHAHILIMSVL